MPERYSFISLPLTASLCVASLCTSALGQMANGSGAALRGEIQTEGAPLGAEKYAVRVSDCGDSGETGRTMLAFDNQFEFRDLKPGCKVVRILTSDEQRLLHEERVLAQNDNVPLLIRLGKAKTDSYKIPPAGSSFTVSVDRLRNPLPPKVVRALADTQRLREAGKWDEAASKLKKLLAQNPSVWQAHLNLGFVEMKLGRPVEALACFSKARELEPRSSKAALDSAIALVTLHRVPEAEDAAREALKLDSTNENAQTFLDRLQMARERGLIKEAPED
jgi:tetratricopeptide (TPR) repeat protein